MPQQKSLFHTWTHFHTAVKGAAQHEDYLIIVDRDDVLHAVITKGGVIDEKTWKVWSIRNMQMQTFNEIIDYINN
jgi:hypothetical protein